MDTPSLRENVAQFALLVAINALVGAWSATPPVMRCLRQVGLVTPSARSTGGFRLYAEADIERLPGAGGTARD